MRRREIGAIRQDREEAPQASGWSRRGGLRLQRRPRALEEASQAPSWFRSGFGLSFIAGMIVGLVMGLSEAFLSSFRAVDVKDLLLGSTALGAAFATVNIGVLALVSTWFDDIYQQVLKGRGGWSKAMRPFRVAATVSLLTTAASLAGLILLAVRALWPRSLTLGIASGLLSWTLIATLVVIARLFEHGKHRAGSYSARVSGLVRPAGR
jgi:hypothetical protein